jgi:hypothetical protein
VGKFPSLMSMRTAIFLMGLVALSLAIAGCGSERRFGDADGVPVTVIVNLDRAYVRGLSSRQVRTSVGAGASFGSGGHRSSGVGVGLTFEATNAYLVGGDGPAEAQVFRKKLSWGENTFTVPLTPGRSMYLSSQVSGGYEGWESVGEVTIPPDGSPTIRVSLLGTDLSVAVDP